jgi:predicted nuclease with TOPRIM domain
VTGHRLLAGVYRQRAVVGRIRALGRRRLAEKLRPRITELEGEIRKVIAQAESIEQHRRIADAVQEMRTEAASVQEQLRKQEKIVSALQAKRDEFAGRVDELRAAKLDAEQGYLDAVDADYDAQAEGAFAAHIRQIQTAGDAMRKAETRFEEAAYGRLAAPGEETEDPTQLAAARGLPSVERELAAARARRDGLAGTAEDLQQHIERLEDVRSSLEEQARTDVEQRDALRAELEQTVDECYRLVSEAEAIEEKALTEAVRPCLTSLGAAVRAQNARISDARSAGAAAPGAETPRQEITRESWITAGLDGLTGEAHMLEAAIHFQQAEDLTSHLQAMRRAVAAGAEEIDLEAIEVQLADAREAAGKAAYAAAEAFEKAIRGDALWVYQANLGTALTMLFQIDPENNEYRTAAIDALRNCTQGREDHPAAVQLVALLEKLERGRTPAPTAEPGEAEPSEADDS